MALELAVLPLLAGLGSGTLVTLAAWVRLDAWQHRRLGESLRAQHLLPVADVRWDDGVVGLAARFVVDGREVLLSMAQRGVTALWSVRMPGHWDGVVPLEVMEPAWARGTPGVLGLPHALLATGLPEAWWVRSPQLDAAVDAVEDLHLDCLLAEAACRGLRVRDCRLDAEGLELVVDRRTGTPGEALHAVSVLLDVADAAAGRRPVHRVQPAVLESAVSPGPATGLPLAVASGRSR